MVHLRFKTIKKLLLGLCLITIPLLIVGINKYQSLKKRLESELYSFLQQEFAHKMGLAVEVESLAIEGIETATAQKASVNGYFCSLTTDLVQVDYSLMDILKKKNGVRFVSFNGGSYGVSKDAPVVESIRGKVSVKQDGLVIEELTGRFSDFPVKFTAVGRIKNTNGESPEVELEAKFFWPNPENTGNIKIAGTINNPSVEGTLNLRDGIADIKGSGDGKNYNLQLNLRHVNIKGADILTSVMFECEKVLKDGQPAVEGKVYTKDSVVDFNPVKEAQGNFMLSRNRITVDRLEWANGYYISCDVTLDKEPFITASLEVNNGDIEDLDYLILRRLSSKNYYNYGVLNGFINCKGSLNEIATTAHLESFEGKLGRLTYQKAVFNVRGIGKLLLIEDTWLYKNKKKVALSGVLDLDHVGEKNYIKQNIAIEGGKTAFAWFDWETDKDALNDTVVLKKALSEETTLGLKSSVTDETTFEENNTLQFEYKVSAFDKLKMELNEENDFIGFERKYNF